MRRQNFNKDWKFYRDGEEEKARILDLPHDAMIEEPRVPELAGGDTCGFYPGGRYIYEKTFPALPKETAAVLLFDGVYQKAKVYLNGKPVGEQIQGYTNFEVPIPGQSSSADGENRLRVVVDNTQVPNARWYTGSGIYRDVTLWTGRQRYIPPYGLRVETLDTDPVRLEVRAETRGLSEEERAEAEIDFTVTAAGGTVIPNTRQSVRWEGSICVAELVLESAALWSAETPVLYTLTAKLAYRGTLQDTAQVRFGVRRLCWSPEKGLEVNGSTVKLRGACVHHDNGILGAREFPETAYRRIRLLKECGYNAIRTAHNEPSELLLEACDELGMYVMAEFTDVWRGCKNDYDYSLYFDKHSRNDLARMVRKCAVHPGVVMYSIGNEVYDTAYTESRDTCGMLCGTIRDLDRTRPITMGFNILGAAFPAKDKPVPPPKHSPDEVVDPRRSGKAAPLVSSKLMNTVTMFLPRLMERVTPEQLEKSTAPLLDQLDLAGLNYGTHLNRLHEVNPRRMIVHTETFPSRIGQTWPQTLACPWVVGDFMWTGWDYLGENGLGVPEYGRTPRRLSKPYPCVSAGTGALNLVGEMEAQGCYTKTVYGQAEQPYIAVRPLDHAGEKVKMSSWRGTDAVCSWAWGQKFGAETTVEVYSSQPRVELLQNGRSLGKKAVQACKAEYRVKYQPGTLEAVAYDGQGRETGRCLLQSDDEATRLCLRAEAEQLPPGGVCYLFAELVDSRGTRKAAADRAITFKVEGAGQLLAVGSGSPWAEDPYAGTTARTWFGTAAAVVQAGKETGRLWVTVSGQGLEPVQLEIPVAGPQ